MKKFLLIILICCSKLLPVTANNSKTKIYNDSFYTISGLNITYLSPNGTNSDDINYPLNPCFPSLHQIIEKDSFLLNKISSFLFFKNQDKMEDVASPYNLNQLSATPCCSESIIYNSTNATIPETASASTSITFDGDFELNPAKDYTFSAGSDIVMNPGFSVSSETGSFTAQIEACTVTTTGLLYAGSNILGCESKPISVNGSFTGNGPIKWTSEGTGKFDDATKLKTTYTPSAADVTKGKTTLTLSSNDASGGCSVATPSSTTIIFSNKPTIDIEGGKESISTTKNIVTLSFVSSINDVAPVATSSKGKAAFIKNAAGVFNQVSLDVSSVTPIPTTPIELKLTVGAGGCEVSDSIMVTFAAEEKSIVIGEPGIKDTIVSCSNEIGIPYKVTGYEGIPDLSADDPKVTVTTNTNNISVKYTIGNIPTHPVKISATLKGTPVLTDFFTAIFTEAPSASILNAKPIKSETSSIDINYAVKGGMATWTVPEGITHVAKTPGKVETFTLTTPSATPVNIELSVIPLKQCPSIDPTIFSISFGSNCVTPPVVQNASPLSVCNTEKTVILKGTSSIVGTSLTFKNAAGVEIPIVGGAGGGGVAEYTFTEADRTKGSASFTVSGSSGPNCVSKPVSFSVKLDAHPLGSVEGKGVLTSATNTIDVHYTVSNGTPKWVHGTEVVNTTKGDGIETFTQKVPSSTPVEVSLVVTGSSSCPPATYKSTITFGVLKDTFSIKEITTTTCADSVVVPYTSSGKDPVIKTNNPFYDKFLVVDKVKKTITFKPTPRSTQDVKIIGSIIDVTKPPISDTITITFAPRPIANIQGNKDTTVTGSSIELGYSTTGTPIWTPTTGVASVPGKEGRINFTPATVTSVPVKLKLTAKLGTCTSADSINITFKTIGSKDSVAFVKNTYTTCADSIVIPYTASGKDPVFKTNDTSLDKFLSVNKTKKTITFKPAKPAPTKPILIIGGIPGATQPGTSDTTTVTFSAPALALIENGKNDTTVSLTSVKLGYKVSGTPTWVPSANIVRVAGKDSIVFTPNPVPTAPVILVLKAVNGTCTSADSINITFKTIGSKDSVAFAKNTYTTCSDSIVIPYTASGKDPVFKTNDTSLDKFLIVNKTKKTVTFKPTKPAPTKPILIIAGIPGATQPGTSDTTTVTFSAPALALIENGKNDTTVSLTSVKLGYKVSGTPTWVPSANIVRVAGKDSIVFTPNPVPTAPVILVLKAVNGTCTSADSINITFKTIGSKDSVAFAKNTYTTCTDSIVIPYTVSGKDPVFKTNDTSLDKFLSVNKTKKTVTFKPAKPAPAKSILIIAGIPGTTQPGTSDTTTVTFSATSTVKLKDEDSVKTVCKADSVLLPFNASSDITWSTSAGSVKESADKKTLVFVPAATKGTAVIKGITKGTAGCVADTSTITLKYTRALMVKAGADQSLCGSNAPVQLTGSDVTGGVAVQWTSTGTGKFDQNPNNLHPVYVPTKEDQDKGTVYLVLHTVENPGCDVTDTMKVDFRGGVKLEAGEPQQLCFNISTVELTGVVPAGTPLIQWSTLSEGATFSSPTKAVTSYTPTDEEKKKGESILILSAGEINCQSHDSVKITYKPTPVPHGGGDKVVCKSSPVIQLNGSIDGGGQGTWNKTGTGQFVPSNESLSVKYIPSAEDLEKGTLQLVLTSKPSEGCPSNSDLVNIKFIDSPTANAGTDITVCSNNSIVQLAGAVSGDSLVWRTNGGGRFSDSTSRKSQYFPSKGDIEKGSVGLTLIPKASNQCIGTGKTLLVTIIGGPSVDAGSDRIICPGEAAVTLNGAVLPAGQGQWSILKGSGTFQNSTALNAKYIPSEGDRKTGEVILTLSSIETAGKCLAETKDIKMRFSDSAVYAGADQQQCIAGTDTVYLNGITAKGVSADWESNGSGTWLNSNVKGFYILSADDKKKDSLVFTLTASSNTSNCNGAVKDIMLVRFTSGAPVVAGKDVTTCTGKNAILSGKISGNTKGIWRALGDGTFKNPNELTTEYLAGTEDIKKGKAAVVLSNENNKCGAGKEDTVNISFIPAPLIEAGSDQVVCLEKDSILLTGIMTGEEAKANTLWSSSGTGKFAAVSSLNTSYLFSKEDKLKESIYVNLIFSTGSCTSKDSLKVSFSKSVLEAGPDQQACFSSPVVNLKGVSAQKSQWSTLGDGHFIPGDTSLTTTYVPGSKDTSNGKVKLILRNTLKGICSAQDDTLSITYFSAPGVSAGQSQTICPGNKVNLEGIITGSSKGIWTTEGDGIFGQKDSLKTTYIPGPKDIAAQKVILTLTSVNEGLCKSAKDTILISINNSSQQLIGKDRKVCSSADTIHLHVPGKALLKNITWHSLGTGSIDTTGNNTLYKFSVADKTAGTVSILFAGQGVGQCGSGKDTMTITFEPLALTKANDEVNICANEKVKLTGTISGGASKGKWISEGDGKFYPTDTSLNAQYKLGIADINKTSLRIFLTSIGGCNTSVDTVNVSIKSNSVVDAGGNTYVCSKIPSINIKGKLLKGNGVKWKTLGDGLFSDNTLPNPTYTFKSNDLKAGSVKLVLSTVGVPGCPPSADTILVKIVDPPKVVLPNKNGDGIDICKSAIADVTGRIIGGLGTGQWTSSGRGKFISDTSLTTQYLPSTLDTTYGTAWLKLSSKGAKECGAASDSIILTIRNFDSPNISNFKNKTVCADGEVSIGNKNNPDYTYKWSPAKGLSSDSVSNPTIILKNKSLKDTTYTFNLLITERSSGFFCTSRDTVRIKVFRPLTSNAGKDTVVCVGQKYTMGEPGAKGFQYRWQGINLSDSTAANPVFTPGPKLAGENIVFTLTSSITGTECKGRDTVSVSVRLGPTFDAGKDTSVCSGDFIKIGTNLSTGNGNKYKWIPATGLSSDTIATPYFVANNTTTSEIKKKISVQLKSSVGCVLEDSVSIIVKPRPATSIILNDTAAFCGKPYTASYAVAGMNESSYNWDVTGGGVERGQGTGSVKINWNNSLSKELRVTQISLNGCKDTLVIPLLNSNISVIINNVTKQAEDNKNYIFWTLKAPKPGFKEQALPKLKLKRVTVGAPNDTLTIGNILNDSITIDNDVDPMKVYQYTFYYKSSCGPELKSISHNNISLGYDILKENNYALLKWNPYETWPKGVGNYDLWRKVDEAEYYKFETDSSNKLSTSYFNDPEAITQCFKVKAVNKDKPSIVSWSNQICVNTKLRIPNAITPNGDYINDSWIIENINLYPENEVQIFNQWHQRIYQKKGYNDDWTGEGHPDGTYYYILKTSKSTVKGYIMIIR